VPNGFAVTGQAYRDALTQARAWDQLHPLLDKIDKTDVADLAARAAQAREIVRAATGTKKLRDEIGSAYRELEKQYHCRQEAWP
jgi:pyruvate, water dikinase